MNQFDDLHRASKQLTQGRLGLCELFWKLGYDYADALLPDLSDALSIVNVLAASPRLIATACYKGFSVLWFPLHDLDKKIEECIYDHYCRLYPYALYLFSNRKCDVWHFSCFPSEPEADTNYAFTVLPDTLSPRALRHISSLAIEDNTDDNILAFYEQIVEVCTTKQKRTVSGKNIKKEGEYWRDSIGWWLDKFRQYPLLNAEEEARLAHLVVEGDSAARDRLVLSNLRLVFSVAKSYARPELPLPDLLQEGHLGLLAAVEKFDVSLGYRFSTYATWWIRRAVTRAVANQGRLIRLPVHVHERLYKIRQISRLVEQHTGCSPTIEIVSEIAELSTSDVEQLLLHQQEILSLEYLCERTEKIELPTYGSKPVDVEKMVLDSALRDEIDRLLEVLKPSQRDVIRMRFGLRDQPEQTLEQVGQTLGVTRERVRQIELQAIKKLTTSSSSLRKFLYEEPHEVCVQKVKRRSRKSLPVWPVGDESVPVGWPDPVPKVPLPVETVEQPLPDLHLENQSENVLLDVEPELVLHHPLPIPRKKKANARNSEYSQRTIDFESQA